MIATPHRTRPVEVMITAPVTTANRGEIARWLEDQGIEVGVPLIFTDPPVGVTVKTRHGHEHAFLGNRVVVLGRTPEVIDQAHYKLWYEPVDQSERTEP